MRPFLLDNQCKDILQLMPTVLQPKWFLTLTGWGKRALAWRKIWLWFLLLGPLVWTKDVLTSFSSSHYLLCLWAFPLTKANPKQLGGPPLCSYPFLLFLNTCSPQGFYILTSWFQPGGSPLLILSNPIFHIAGTVWRSEGTTLWYEMFDKTPPSVCFR